ncbi:DUF4291 family protein [Streptomyces sp. B21-108]|uniref:DUF4291 family protein n=1 Tax=Streptomyces sp. B21-108 TaxID=3039419 RepID=UPI002FEF72C1
MNDLNDLNDRPVQPEPEPEPEPRFRIRARHTESTLTVYQAYRPQIGKAVARTGRIPSTWSRERTTWIIKPCSQTLFMLLACGGKPPCLPPDQRACAAV